MTSLALAFALSLVAQDIKIEVAVIKPVPTNERTIFTNGRTVHASCNLECQIQWAYDAIDCRVEGLPAWVGSRTQGWDITVKAEGDTALTVPQFRQMMRTLLSEKFQLKVHKVVEELPVYALVVDKGGPKFKESAAGTRRSERIVDGQRLEGTHYDMARFADRLRRELDHRVIDRTGLGGFYDLKLEWGREETAPVRDATGPSLFTAVRTQLGLKLELWKKHPVEFIVVDHAEKPNLN